MTRKSAGEVYAQVKAEAANPRADIWWGGTGDPHLQAAEEGLTIEYKSPKNGGAAGLGRAPVGAVEGAHHRHLFGRARLRLQHRAHEAQGRARSRSAGPTCSTPKFKDEVQVADPNSSGTSYTLLATIVQLMGEDKGFDYLKALHKNVNQYTKSGAAPAKAMALGETTVGIAFMHDIVTMVVDKAPDQGRRALRGHRLRDRLDVDHQGRQESRQRQEVLRLGADRRRAEARRRGEILPGAVEQEHADPAGGAEARRRSS